MAYKTPEGSKDNMNDQVWQNSLGYLGILQDLDVQINEHLSVGNLTEVVQLLRQLLIFLERISKKEAGSNRSKEFNKLMPKIKELQEEVIKTPKDAFLLKKAQFDRIEEIYLDIGDMMYNLDLVFKQGIDPIDAWALQ